MADDRQRTLLIKNLENSKLRQRIKELENESAQIETKHAEELSILTHETENIKRQNEIEKKTKIRQLQQNNQKLMEDLVEARRSQCRAEEEVVVVSEKNCQLIYDLKNVQQEYANYKTKLEAISMEGVKKEYELQKALEDLRKFRQQNAKLQSEFANLSNSFKETKGEMRKKDAQILQLTNHLEEYAKDILQQETLQKTIQKLQAEKSTLQLEIENTDANRNKMAEILLKNKELLAGNRKLKAENENLQKHLENQLIRNNANTEGTNQALEVAQLEISELKQKTVTLGSELHEVGLALKDKEELLNCKCDLEKENQFLKKKSQANVVEMEIINQSMTTLVNEKCELQQRVLDLEESNFKKIHIIAKLKARIDQSS